MCVKIEEDYRKIISGSVKETERIYIRPIQHTDTNAIFAYRSLECVAQYQYREPFTMQKSLDFVEQYSCVDVNTKGIWIGFVIILKSNNALIGDCVESANQIVQILKSNCVKNGQSREPPFPSDCPFEYSLNEV